MDGRDRVVSLGTIIDVLLAVLLGSYAVSGWRQGLLMSVASLVGFLGGGALGMALLPRVLGSWTWALDRPAISKALLILGVFALATSGQVLLALLARRVRARMTARPVVTLDSLLGAIATMAAVAVLVWFVAGGLRGVTSGPAARAIGESRVLQAIDSVVPPQTGQLFAGFRQMLDRGGFPKVFEGLQAEPITPVAPPDGTITSAPAVQAALGSVVKITGVAAACRQGQEGSGFVVAPGRVVTNAHVVAGLGEASVRVRGTGPALRGRVVVFDPQRDLAVLAVTDLAAPALTQGPRLEREALAVVAGFPLDGPLRVDPARVRQRLTATGADIYGAPGVTREIYSLYTHVEPGNSGGPLLDAQGRLVGVVFAKSLDDDATGYALTLQEAGPVLDAAASASVPVPTGSCQVG